jgi:uncharacterized protein YegP (UPF0339 family)
MSKQITKNGWRIEIQEAVTKPKQYYFNILAPSIGGELEVVATSETYHNLKDCKKTALSIQTNVNNAEIVVL